MRRTIKWIPLKYQFHGFTPLMRFHSVKIHCGNQHAKISANIVGKTL